MSKASSLATAWARSPLLHFLVLGSVLFVGQRSLRSERRPEVVIGNDRIERLQAEFRLDSGAEPEESTLEALIAKEVDDELLLAWGTELGLPYEGPTAQRLQELASFLGADGEGDELVRWAIAENLHHHDGEARRRLLEATVASLVTADPEDGADDLPPDSKLQALLENHADRYRTPVRFDLTQIFLSRSRQNLAADAARMVRRLSSEGIGPEAAEQFSDPSPLPVRLGFLNRRGLRLRFGDEVADAIRDLEPGRWSEPISAADGVHLFWLEERRPSRLPRLDEIRDRLLADWLEDRREARRAAGMARLRQRYRVRIERSAQSPGAL